MPLKPPEWSESNDVHAAQIAAQTAVDRQKVIAAPMSKDFRVETWQEFEAAFQEIEAKNKGVGVWYRGQSKACWKLDTTLERRSGGQFPVNEYFRIMQRVKTEIETYTERSWDDFDIAELETDLEEYALFSLRLSSGKLPYEYMAYLRHHGFPSPLLDWSGSPYIAAHFAFAAAKPSDDDAVYALVERTEDMKVGGSDRPNIAIAGPNIRTHKRHYLQRSRYTICAEFERSIGWQFVPHQKVFDLGEAKQDVLWKIVIPASERGNVLRLLDRVNLNAYSLFGSEDSLMETLAMREIDLKP